MPNSTGEEVITEPDVEGQGPPRPGRTCAKAKSREEAGVFEGWQEVLVAAQRVQQWNRKGRVGRAGGASWCLISVPP